ncbi:MAG: MipA/OmpV family protein [Burkholderiales bacterium]|nr:MipA/OmpV family protein [Burkholderiales bacterium]
MATGRFPRQASAGVSRSEARPLYSSGAATNVGFGLDSYYQVTKSSAIMVGASGLRLGGAPADGALYTNRWQAILYGGYAIRF